MEFNSMLLTVSDIAIKKQSERSYENLIQEEFKINNNFLELKEKFSTFEQVISDNHRYANDNFVALEEKISVNNKILESLKKSGIVENYRPVAPPRTKVNQLSISTSLDHAIPDPLKTSSRNTVQSEKNNSNSDISTLNVDIITKPSHSKQTYNRDDTVEKLLTRSISKLKFDQRSTFVQKQANRHKVLNQSYVEKLLNRQISNLHVDPSKNLPSNIYKILIESLVNKRNNHDFLAKYCDIIEEKINDIVSDCISHNSNDFPHFTKMLNDINMDYRKKARELYNIGGMSARKISDKSISDIENPHKYNQPMFRKRVLFDLNQMENGSTEETESNETNT